MSSIIDEWPYEETTLRVLSWPSDRSIWCSGCGARMWSDSADGFLDHDGPLCAMWRSTPWDEA